MIALREPECCALARTNYRSATLRLWVSRPQLKRDPLGSMHTSEMRVRFDFLLALASAAGCTLGGSGRAEQSVHTPDCVSALLAHVPSRNSVREFHVCPATDTSRIGRSILLHYFITNGAQAVRLNAANGFFVRLESESGDSVSVYSKGSLTHSDGPGTVFTLPAWGVLGQTVDITCMPLDPYHPGDCWWGYRPSRPGRYRVISTFRITYALTCA